MWIVCTQYRREMHFNNSPTGSAGPAALRSMWPSGGIIALYSDYLGHFLCAFCVPWGGGGSHVFVCVCLFGWRTECIVDQHQWRLHSEESRPSLLWCIILFFFIFVFWFLFICLLFVLIAVSRWDINCLERIEMRTERESCSISVPNCVGILLRRRHWLVVWLFWLLQSNWSHGECVFVLTGYRSCNLCEGRSHGQAQGGRPKLQDCTSPLKVREFVHAYI